MPADHACAKDLRKLKHSIGVIALPLSTTTQSFYAPQLNHLCFGTRDSSVFSTSSSSSDEFAARVIDLPTVRRLNSPRCAPCGNAYNHSTQAASDMNRAHNHCYQTSPDAADTRASKAEDKQKNSELELLQAAKTMLASESY